MSSEDDAMRREAEALVRAGETLLAQEKRAEAVLQFQRAAVCYAELQMKPELGRLKLRIGECILALGQAREAEFFVRQALEMLLALGTPVEVARCYHLLGFCQKKAGKIEDAKKSLEAAAFLFEKDGEKELAREARELAAKV